MAGRKWGITSSKYGISLRADKNVLILIVMMITQLCELLKTIEQYTLSDMVCELYLNKVAFF